MGSEMCIRDRAMCKRGFALTGAILYAVSMVLFPMYFFFVIVQMILSFVGFAKLKKPRPAASDPSNKPSILKTDREDKTGTFCCALHVFPFQILLAICKHAK